MLVGAVHNQRLSSAEGTIDLLVKLELPGVGLLDFKRVAEVADRGYAASIDTVPACCMSRDSNSYAL